MDQFIQGYICAVCNLIRMNGGVDSTVKELYNSGISKYTLLELAMLGVPYSDLNTLESYYRDLI